MIKLIKKAVVVGFAAASVIAVPAISTAVSDSGQAAYWTVNAGQAR